MEKIASYPLFNSPFEAGIRAVIILNTIYPKTCDLNMLVWLDHLVVHTEDIGGPRSLHPDVPQRNGELLVRRSIVESGIETMRRVHLIETSISSEGIIHSATDETFNFVQKLKSRYSVRLKERAGWLKEHICNRTSDEIEKIVTEKIGRWNLEFQSFESPGEKR